MLEVLITRAQRRANLASMFRTVDAFVEVLFSSARNFKSVIILSLKKSVRRRNDGNTEPQLS